MSILLSIALGSTSFAFDPLAALSPKEICSSDELLLIRYPFEELQSNFQKICCTPEALGESDMRCIMDWPFNDVPSCKAYDIMRNSIFARYGYSFKSEEWKTHFASASWYEPRADYTEQWLRETAKQNVTTLKKRASNKVGCMD